MAPKKAKSKAAAASKVAEGPAAPSVLQVPGYATEGAMMQEFLKYQDAEERLKKEALELREKAQKMAAEFEKAAGLIKASVDPNADPEQRRKARAEMESAVQDSMPKPATVAKGKKSAKAKAKPAAGQKDAHDDGMHIPRPDVAVQEVKYCLLQAHKKEQEAAALRKKMEQLEDKSKQAADSIRNLASWDVAKDEVEMLLSDSFAAKTTKEEAPKENVNAQPTYSSGLEEIEEEDFQLYCKVIAKKCARGNESIRQEIIEFLEEAAQLAGQLEEGDKGISGTFGPFNASKTSEQSAAEEAECAIVETSVDVMVKRQGADFVMSHTIWTKTHNQ